MRCMNLQIHTMLASITQQIRCFWIWYLVLHEGDNNNVHIYELNEGTGYLKEYTTSATLLPHAQQVYHCLRYNLLWATRAALSLCGSHIGVRADASIHLDGNGPLLEDGDFMFDGKAYVGCNGVLLPHKEDESYCWLSIILNFQAYLIISINPSLSLITGPIWFERYFDIRPNPSINLCRVPCLALCYEYMENFEVSPFLDYFEVDQR